VNRFVHFVGTSIAISINLKNPVQFVSLVVITGSVGYVASAALQGLETGLIEGLLVLFFFLIANKLAGNGLAKVRQLSSWAFQLNLSLHVVQS